MMTDILLGLQTAMMPTNLMWCLVGVFLGTLIGVIPGIGALAAISMLFPLTFHLDTTAALIMLAGIWYGSTYGGSTAAILLNVPGTPSSAVAALEGHPMSKQGRAGVALFITAIASFVGASVGIVIMMLFSPAIAEYALEFGAAEYFSLMLMGLIASSTISFGSTAKSLSMVALGIILGCVGMDAYTAVPRFTFGMLHLYDSISLMPLAMGLFGIAEIAANVGMVDHRRMAGGDYSMRAMMPTRDDWRRSAMPSARGAALGSFLGALPGVGPAIASFMSYAIEKRLAREPERFGNGAIEGIVAPETANNAADQTAFIPTMTLGIPGSPSMAIMIGVLMIQGITPGPTLLRDHPELFWGLVMSFWIGNILLLIINIPLISLWVRMLTVPYRLLYPSILVFVCMGVYSIGNSAADVWLVVVFGVAGYVLRVLDFSPAPLILGFVLGPMMEEYFRRAMLVSRGDPMIFVERPVSATILGCICLLVLWRLAGVFRQRRLAGARQAPEASVQ